jgi:hypothetical protein
MPYTLYLSLLTDQPNSHISDLFISTGKPRLDRHQEFAPERRFEKAEEQPPDCDLTQRQILFSRDNF